MHDFRVMQINSKSYFGHIKFLCNVPRTETFISVAIWRSEIWPVLSDKIFSFFYQVQFNFQNQVQTSNKNPFYYYSKQWIIFLPLPLLCAVSWSEAKFYDFWCHFRLKKKEFFFKASLIEQSASHISPLNLSCAIFH